jgi:hypothetical protein
MHLGLSSHEAVAAAVLSAAMIAGGVLLVSRGSDVGWFTAALVVGILSSPIVWDHYFVMLFVCLAATRRAHDVRFWMLVALLWACPVENPANLWQAWLVPVASCALALRVAQLSRSPELELSQASGAK